MFSRKCFDLEKIFYVFLVFHKIYAQSFLQPQYEILTPNSLDARSFLHFFSSDLAGSGDELSEFTLQSFTGLLLPPKSKVTKNHAKVTKNHEKSDFSCGIGCNFVGFWSYEILLRVLAAWTIYYKKK